MWPASRSLAAKPRIQSVSPSAWWKTTTSATTAGAYARRVRARGGAAQTARATRKGDRDEQVRAGDRGRRPDRRAGDQELPRVGRRRAHRAADEGAGAAVPPAAALEALPARRGGAAGHIGRARELLRRERSRAPARRRGG